MALGLREEMVRYVRKGYLAFEGLEYLCLLVYLCWKCEGKLYPHESGLHVTVTLCQQQHLHATDGPTVLVQSDCWFYLMNRYYVHRRRGVGGGLSGLFGPRSAAPRGRS